MLVAQLVETLTLCLFKMSLYLRESTYECYCVKGIGSNQIVFCDVSFCGCWECRDQQHNS